MSKKNVKKEVVSVEVKNQNPKEEVSTIENLKSEKDKLKKQLADLRAKEKELKASRKRGPSILQYADELLKVHPEWKDTWRTGGREQLTRALISDHQDKACITICSMVRKIKI